MLRPIRLRIYAYAHLNVRCKSLQHPLTRITCRLITPYSHGTKFLKKVDDSCYNYIVVIDYKSVASYEIKQFVTCRLCLRC